MTFNNDSFNKFISSLKPEDPVTKYALAVFTNQIITSKMVFYQAKRHLLFLYHQENSPDFPFIFKPERINSLLKFTENIIIPETRQVFVFPDFRKFIAGFVLGWVYKKNPNVLITKEVFDIEARKQWKSSFWAMFALAVSRGITNDNSTQTYIVGPQREASRIVYDTALSYISSSKKMRLRFSKYNTLQILSKKNGQIRALAFEKKALEGKNPSLVILTEYHLHKDDSLQESATLARNASRPNYLLVYDTTKGYSIDSPCFQREKTYKKFLLEQIQNPETISEHYNIFLWAAELDPEDYQNWRDSSLWIKANPNLGVSVSLQQLQNEMAQISSRRQETEFKIKRLGMWVSLSSSYFDWNDIQLSQQKNEDYVLNLLKSGYFVNHYSNLGIDLSSSIDTTAIAQVWEVPQEDGEPLWVFKVKGFVPDSEIEAKITRDNAAYFDWKQQGFVDFHPGRTISYQKIADYLSDLKKTYKIYGLFFDPWHFSIVKDYLIKGHIFDQSELFEVKQGSHLSPVFMRFEKKLKDKKLFIFDNNLYAFSHILNTAVKVSENGNSNLFIKKVNPQQRIDAFIAMLTAACHLYKQDNINNLPYINIL